MSTTNIVDDDGRFQGGWGGSEFPSGFHSVPSAPSDARQIWDFDNEVWLPLPDPPAPPKVPVMIASAKLTIEDGDIQGFTTESGLIGGSPLDVGKFEIYLATELSDANYIVNAFDGGLFRCYVQPEDYSAGSFIVTTTDLSGNPADPACISVIVTKAL